MNSNGILNQLRPNGYNGEIYNFRASNIFHFKPQTTPGSFPESGESGVYNECIALRNNLLTSIEEGLILSFIVPEGCSNLNKIYIFNNSTTPLNSEPIEIKISNLEVNKWYLMVYNGSNFSNVNIYPDNRVTYDSENAITSKAVYEYVSSIATSSLSYKICPPEASKIPAGVIYNDGNNTITGTLVADIQTEKIIYLVKNNSVNNDSYDEYLTILNNNVYSWEKIGSTGVNINSIIDIINPHTFTPSGSVDQPDFNGIEVTTNQEGTHIHDVTPNGEVSSTFSGEETTISGITTGHQHAIVANSLIIEGKAQITGEIDTPTFTGESVSTSQESAHIHDIQIGDVTVVATFDPAQNLSISSSTLSGNETTISVANTTSIDTENAEHVHKIKEGDIIVNGTIKVDGSVGQPVITVNNDTFAKITSVGTPSAYSVTNEVLTLTPSTVPQTTDHTITVSASAPSFNGGNVEFSATNKNIITIDGGSHHHSIAANAIQLSTKYTPSGEVSSPTITSKPISITCKNSEVIHTLEAGNHSHTVTAKGQVSQPTFTGGEVTVHSTNTTDFSTTTVSDKFSATYQPEGTVTSTFEGQSTQTTSNGEHTHKVTPKGTVTQPAFHGDLITLPHTQITE